MTIDLQALTLAVGFAAQLAATVWAAARWKYALDSNTAAVQGLTRRMESTLDDRWAANLAQLNPEIRVPGR